MNLKSVEKPVIIVIKDLIEKTYGRSVEEEKLVAFIESCYEMRLAKETRKDMTQKRNKLNRDISTLTKVYRNLEIIDFVLDECDECGHKFSDGETPYDTDGDNEVWECDGCGKMWRVSPDAYPKK